MNAPKSVKRATFLQQRLRHVKKKVILLFRFFSASTTALCERIKRFSEGSISIILNASV